MYVPKYNSERKGNPIIFRIKISEFWCSHFRFPLRGNIPFSELCINSTNNVHWLEN